MFRLLAEWGFGVLMLIFITVGGFLVGEYKAEIVRDRIEQGARK